MTKLLKLLWQGARIAFGKEATILYQEKECPVCKVEEEMLGLGCGHPICEECLFVLTDNRCPVCRRDVALDKAKRLLLDAPKCSAPKEVLKLTIRAKDLGDVHVAFFIAVVLTAIVMVASDVIRGVFLANALSVLWFVALDPEILTPAYTIAFFTFFAVDIAHNRSPVIAKTFSTLRASVGVYGLFWSSMYFLYSLGLSSMQNVVISATMAVSVRIMLSGYLNLPGVLSYGLSVLLLFTATALPTCAYLSVARDECCVPAWALLSRLFAPS